MAFGKIPSRASAGVGTALTQPQVPTGQAEPSQMGMWGKFMEKVKTDPNFRMALMTTGANLLRTPELGQNGFDTFADASLSGMTTLDSLRQRDRTQGNEDIDRSFSQSATNRQLSQGDRRLGIQDERTEIAEDNAALGRDRLEEQKRQFDATLAAGYYSNRGRAGSITGPERMTTAARDAFLASGIYPDTEQGRAMAELSAQGLVATDLVTPQSRLKAALELAPGIALMNNMSEREAFDSALAFVNSAADKLNEEERTPPEVEGQLEGRTIEHDSQGAGIVEKVGDDLYRVKFDRGFTNPLSGDQIRKMLGEE